jgi:hypothetical protein
MSPRSLMRWGCGLACLGNAAMMVAPDYGTVVFAYAWPTWDSASLARGSPPAPR